MGSQADSSGKRVYQDLPPFAVPGSIHLGSRRTRLVHTRAYNPYLISV
jgi:hypothetical protein